jgi:hypothetical protein
MMKNAKKTLLLLLVVLAIAPLFSSFIGAQ